MQVPKRARRPGTYENSNSVLSGTSGAGTRTSAARHPGDQRGAERQFRTSRRGQGILVRHLWHGTRSGHDFRSEWVAVSGRALRDQRHVYARFRRYAGQRADVLHAGDPGGGNAAVQHSGRRLRRQSDLQRADQRRFTCQCGGAQFRVCHPDRQRPGPRPGHLWRIRSQPLHHGYAGPMEPAARQAGRRDGAVGNGARGGPGFGRQWRHFRRPDSRRPRCG